MNAKTISAGCDLNALTVTVCVAAQEKTGLATYMATVSALTAAGAAKTAVAIQADIVMALQAQRNAALAVAQFLAAPLPIVL